MSLHYPNAGREFANNYKAYVIIDPNNVDEVIKLIVPAGIENTTNIDKKVNFQGCYIKSCDRCIEISKPCRNKT